MKSFTLKVRDARIRRAPGHVLTGRIGRSVQAQALAQLLLRDGDARRLDRDVEGRADALIGDSDLLGACAAQIGVGRKAAGDGLRFARSVGIADAQTGGIQLVADIIGCLARPVDDRQRRLPGGCSFSGCLAGSFAGSFAGCCVVPPPLLMHRSGVRVPEM